MHSMCAHHVLLVRRQSSLVPRPLQVAVDSVADRFLPAMCMETIKTAEETANN